MKVILFCLLAPLLLPISLQAGPKLMVEASLTEKHLDGSRDEWKAKPVTVASGKTAIFHMGGFEWKVTPAMNQRGQVVVPFFITRGNGRHAQLLSRPTITTRLGQVVSVGIEGLTFSVVTTRAK